MKKTANRVSRATRVSAEPSSTVAKKAISLTINYNVLLVVLLVVAAFLIGRLTAQVEYLKKGIPSSANNQQNDQAAGQPTASTIDENGLKDLAKKVGLNVDKFNSCLSDGKYAKKVGDDLAYGTSVGVSGTPTFFFNGVMLVGAYPQSKFEEVIDAELKNRSGDKVANTEGRKTIQTNVGPVRGNKNAPVKIVEFADFQCPYCVKAFPTVEAVLKKYGDKVSLEYRHNPLSFHPYAQKAAEAAECANEQGKFWEMHDAMFGSQNTQG